MTATSEPAVGFSGSFDTTQYKPGQLDQGTYSFWRWLTGYCNQDKGRNPFIGDTFTYKWVGIRLLVVDLQPETESFTFACHSVYRYQKYVVPKMIGVRR